MVIKQEQLDKQLHEILSSGKREEIFDFCAPLIVTAPVTIDLKETVEKTIEFLENAMILYSGYHKEEFPKFADAAQQLVRQEVESGRWSPMDADEKGWGLVISQRALEAIRNTRAEVTDADKVFAVIGMYAYATVLCNDGLDAWSFIHLFVYGWISYFSDWLSVPAMLEKLSGGLSS